MAGISGASSGSVLGFEEAPGSGKQVSGATSLTASIGDSYDLLRVEARIVGDPFNIGVRLNGISTADYDYVDTSGSTVTGQAQFNLINGRSTSAEPQVCVFYVRGRPTPTYETAQFSAAGPRSQSTQAMDGQVTPISTPVDSITLFDRFGAVLDLKLNIYGKNL
jgi:hypothetical protein